MSLDHPMIVLANIRELLTELIAIAALLAVLLSAWTAVGIGAAVFWVFRQLWRRKFAFRSGGLVPKNPETAENAPRIDGDGR